MTTSNSPISNIQADTVTTPPSAPPGLARFRSATVTLTEDGQWPASIDTTRHIKMWGLQQSFDSGTNWVWGPVFTGPPDGDSTHRYGVPDQTQPAGYVFSTTPPALPPEQFIDFWTPFGLRTRGGDMPSLQVTSTKDLSPNTVELR